MLVLMSNECAEDECNAEYGYHPEQSRTFKGTTRPAGAEYLDRSSYSGVWASDKITIGDFTIPRYSFGLIDKTASEGDSRSLIGLGWAAGKEETPSLPSVCHGAAVQEAHVQHVHRPQAGIRDRRRGFGRVLERQDYVRVRLALLPCKFIADGTVGGTATSTVAPHTGRR
jgi:hypothetical protein